MEKNSHKLRLIIRDIFTSGTYDKCEPGVMYKFMMLNLVIIVGDPFVLGFGLFDISRGIEPLGYIITAASIAIASCFYFLRKTKKYTVVGNFFIFILFWMFLYLLSTGGTGNSGMLWYYSFPPIVLFLLGFRKGSVVVFASLLFAGVILFWPGTPFLSATYSGDIRIRFIPSVVILWAITSLFEQVLSAALKIEIKNNELRETLKECKLAEEALRQSESKYRTLLENLQQKIFYKDKNSVYISCNNSYATDLRIISDEVAGKTDLDFFPKELAEKYMAHDKKVMELGKTEDMEEKYIRDGQEFWIHTVKTPIRDESGNVTGILGIFWDITAQKNVEEALRKSEEQLRHAQKMEAVGILAGGVAHEFNNILATIKGSAYIIQKKLKTDSSLNKYSEQMTASINKASTLAQSLLAFSRKQIIDMKPANLNKIILKVKPLVSELIGENIELSIVLTARVPTIMADSNQLEQLLINLTINARDAMQKGGQLSIVTDIEEIGESFIKEHGFGVPGKYAMIVITDTGTGIAADIRDRIFEPFFTTKELGKGTGLGLSIVYGIIKQHNGYIDVKTGVSEGASFKIYIPAVESKVDEAARQHCPDVIGGLETILLAEDDADTRRILSEVLRLEGYTVLDAIDGEEAIGVLNENKGRIHLALLDVRMPKKDGKEVYDEIRRASPDIKCLFLSGYTADVIDSDEFSRSGLNFISKSVTYKEILWKIREILDEPLTGLNDRR